jgi:hypothetical protein
MKNKETGGQVEDNDYRHMLSKQQGGCMKQEVEKISINGVAYVREDSVSKEEVKGDIKIVILQRGWIMVGRFEREGNDCKLHNASVIRSWGTTKGLGELALGITISTKLDKCNGLVQFDYLTVVAMVDCKEDKWADVL